MKGRDVMTKVANEIENLEAVDGGKLTVGDIVSFPLRVPMYIIGANIAGFVLGAYEGFGDVWYTSHPEKRWAKGKEDKK